MREGRLTPVAPSSENGAGAGTAVTYHDPWYIGRHNGVYDSPPGADRRAAGGPALGDAAARQPLVLLRRRAAPGCRWRRSSAPGSTAPAPRRRWPGADQIAVTCPFCREMLSDALTSQRAAGSAPESVEVVDVAQMLLAAVRRGTPA